MTIDQQVALDEAFVPHAHRLRIGKRNFRLLSDISSKESTLQLVYYVLRHTPFFKAFLVTVDVPEIYMQEFWATATVHHHSIQFKMDNKKHIVNLESFREMLHIFLRLPGETFDEPPFEEEILAFIQFLGHSGAIRRLTDVNINKLHQPWRSFAAIINKCLSGISSGYDSLRLSQAQFLWGFYHKRNDLSIPRRNKVNWHYVRDDQMFTTIKLEYYVVAIGATPPKTKASVQKTKSSFDTTVTPPLTAAVGTRLFTSGKGKQPATTSKAKILTALSEKSSDEGDDDDDEGNDDDDDDDAQDDDDDQEDTNKDDDDQEEGDDEDDQEEGSDDEQASDEEGEEFIHPSLSTHDEEEIRDEESFDPIPKTPENTDDGGNGEENIGMNVGREEGQDEEDEEDELYRDVNINLTRGVQMADVHTTQEFEDSHVTLTPVNPDGQQQSSSMSFQFVTSMLNPTPDAGIESIFETTSQMDVQAPTSVAPLPVSAPTLTPSTISTITTILEANFSEFTQTNQFAGAVSSIPKIVQRYMDQRMNEAVKVAVQIQSVRLCDEAQAENDEFLNTIDENMQKIIKEQVKEHVKVQVSKILPKIEQTVNEQLEAEVLTRSSNLSKTSYAVAADLSEMELKKILIEKMEGNKDVVMMMRIKMKNPPLDQTGGPRDEEKERSQSQQALQKRKLPGALASLHKGLNLNKRLQASLQQQGSQCRLPMRWKSPHIQSLKQKPPTPDRDWNKTLPATHGSIQPWISELEKQTDSRSSFNELMDSPVDFSAFLMNRLKVDTLTPELLDGPTYELMKGSCKSLVELEFFLEEVYKATTDQLDWVNPEGQQYPHNLLKPLPLIPNSRGRHVIPFDHFINNNLEYLRGGASSRKYTTSVTKTKAADYGHIKWIEDSVPRTMWIQEPVCYDKHALWGISHWGRKRQQFYGFSVNRESARDVYSKRRIIAEGDFKRLRIQDIEDMLLLLVQGKLTNLTVEERLAFNVSLRMFTRSIVIQRRVEDLQLGVESYQKKLNLTRPDTDGTLTDVRTALDDRLKGIQMKYLPQTIWRKSDKDRAAAMIQDIDKQLKTRRIMRSLERFVGRRLYEGDFRML
nr:hypothetical protein [Tanacetum cinerariifolium]